jgi:hypothetical protein
MPHRLHEKNDGIEGHTLATLWQMSFEATRSNENAWIVLGILCCLQPDEIPKAVFLPNDSSITTGKLLFCEDEDEWV